MSPSFRHEHAKTLVARLLEAWALESRVPLNGYGNVTLKRAGERALEPDECYGIGNVEQTPDLAIEVVVSKRYVDKTAVYQTLGVREIWTWQAGASRCWSCRPNATSCVPTVRSSRPRPHPAERARGARGRPERAGALVPRRATRPRTEGLIRSTSLLLASQTALPQSDAKRTVKHWLFGVCERRALDRAAQRVSRL
jgi:hypothetical protein